VPVGFFFDEDLNRNIVRGLLRRVETLNHSSVHEAGMLGHTDEDVLDRAHEMSQVVVSHDVNTMIAALRRRQDGGRPTSGLILVPQSLSVRTAIEDLELICRASDPQDWVDGTVVFLPL